MPLTTDAFLLGSWAPLFNDEKVSVVNVLDVGTGTGVLSLMLAQRYGLRAYKSLVIKGIDIDSVSVDLANENFKSSNWSRSLEVYQKDFNIWCSESKPASYHQIICNPPFFKNSLTAQSEMANRSRHEQAMSLKLLFQGILYLLAEEGTASIILPAERMDEAASLIGEKGLYISAKMLVSLKAGGSFDRVLLSITKEIKRAVAKEALAVYQSKGVYSEAYKKLTEEFYL